MPTNEPSPTPILDLLEPLPKPFDERISGRFAAPLLTAVACIVIGQNYSLLAIVFGALLIGFLTTFTHELGHVCAAWAVGFRFHGVTIGPFVVKRLRTGMNIRIRPRMTGGFAYMIPDKICRLRKRSIVLCLGGPLASLVVGVAAVVAGETAHAYYDSPWPTFLDFFGLYSVFIGLYSFSSYRSGAYAGDGMLLRALIKSKEEARQLIAANALSVLASKNPDGVHGNPRWQRLALLDSRFTTPFHRAW